MGPRIRAWQPATLAISALAALFVLSGCRLDRRFPAQPQKIVGSSYNPGLALQMIPSLDENPDWEIADSPFDRTIDAWAEADVPGAGLGSVQGRLVAKQEAKQRARRKLARQIETLEVRPGVTVADVIRDDSAKRAKVEELVQQAREVAVIKSDSGTYSVSLRLGLHPLIRLFPPGAAEGDSASSFSITTVSPEEFRKRAQADAIENARMRALEYVKSRRLNPTETVGDLMLRNDEVDRAIRQLVQSLRPLRVGFLGDGTCEAVLIIDLADVHRIVAGYEGDTGRSTRLSWLKRGSRWQAPEKTSLPSPTRPVR
jgi:hypothetical protein